MSSTSIAKNRLIALGLVSVSLLTGLVSGGVIGNIPFQSMKRDAVLIIAGVVHEVRESGSASQWTIRVTKAYKGTPGATVVASSTRRISASELQQVRGKLGLFMVNKSGFLIHRTGSILVTDLFVPVDALSSAPEPDVALCIDWMRGLTKPENLILRDLAVAAADCGADPRTTADVRLRVGGSPKASDELINILTGLANSDPAAVLSLEAWVQNNLGSPRERPWALYAYSSPDASASLALRRMAFDSRVPRRQEAAAIVLAYIHSDETWLELAALLDSPDTRVMWIALQGLQKTVDAGELGESAAAFERPLVHRGNAIVRSVRRPIVPPSNRVPPDPSGADEAALVRYWRQYAAANR